MNKRGLLALVFLSIFLMLPMVFAADSSHHIYRSHSYVPARGLTYTVNTISHSSAGREEEHILRYSPDSSLLPVVYSSPRMYGGAVTMTDALASLRGKGYNPVAAINGDFYNPNGTPVSIMIQNGTLITFNNELAALGFDGEGKPFISNPKITIKVTGSTGQTLMVDSLNKTRTADKVHLYTRHFSDNTRTTAKGRHVVLQVNKDLQIGQSLTGTVTKIIDGTSAYTLQNNEMVLSASSESSISRLSFLTVGMTITMGVDSSIPRWNSAVMAVGGLKFLVLNGKQVTFGDTTRAPRTTAGITESGELILYTVDGRQPGYSNGLTNDEQGKRMLELGCVTALELDGGGSTVMGLRMPGDNDFKLVSKPSDSTLRRSANYLFFCNTSPKTDVTSYLFPNPAYVTMLPHASVSFNFRATDRNYHPVIPPQYGYTGTVNGSDTGTLLGAVFNSLSPGHSILHFTNEQAAGAAEVHVTDTLDSLTLLDRQTNTGVSSLEIATNRSFYFTAGATLNLQPVLSTPASFVWSVEGDIGEFTEPGVFRSCATVGSKGFISVSACGLTVRIPVTVGHTPQKVAAFETSLDILGEGGVLFRAEHSTNPCLSGLGSAKLSYQFVGDSTTPLSLPLTKSVTSAPSMLYLLVQGDGSGNTLSLRAVTGLAATSDLFVCNLDFTDTRLISVALPERITALSSFLLSNQGDRSGVFYIDELVFAWENLALPPKPTVSIGESYISYDILNIPITIDKSASSIQQIQTYWDGEPVETPLFDENGEGLFLTHLPQEGLHILTVEITDVFGRRAREKFTIDCGLTESNLILDVNDHWSKSLVYFLHQRGIIEPGADYDLAYFEPERDATRLEIFRMLYNLLSPDPALYEHIILPFTDTAEINQWDLPVIRALYALGLVSGKADGSGKLTLDLYSPIIRADISVLLAKTQKKGFTDSLFETFEDHSLIPNYAKESMRLMVDLKALVGYNQKLNPMDNIKRSECAALFCHLFF